MSDLYDTDYVAWTDQQAGLLRRMAAGERVNDQVDWDNVAEEIETLGRSERSRLASHICTVLEHLMRLQASPATEPRRGWRATVGRARLGIAKVLKENPGLMPTVATVVADEHQTGRELVLLALEEYGETPTVPLDALSYTEDQVLGPWLPDPHL
jgi:hypothetical protein